MPLPYVVNCRGAQGAGGPGVSSGGHGLGMGGLEGGVEGGRGEVGLLFEVLLKAMIPSYGCKGHILHTLIIIPP